MPADCSGWRAQSARDDNQRRHHSSRSLNSQELAFFITLTFLKPRLSIQMFRVGFGVKNSFDLADGDLQLIIH